MILASVAALVLCKQAGQLHPNIILFNVDDLGYADTQVYGGTRVPTPNINSLAARGVVFTDAYVTAPICAASRAGLITGCYPQRWGLYDNPPVHGYSTFPLPRTHKSMPEYLRELGYRTSYLGKWGLGRSKDSNPLTRGIEEFYGFYAGGPPMHLPHPDQAPMYVNTPLKEVVPDYLSYAFTRKAVKYIQDHKAEPFFMAIGHWEVHRPYEAPPELMSRFGSLPEEQRAYCAMISGIDDSVGAIVAEVRRQGIEKDTVIIFTSDNGGRIRPDGAIKNTPFIGGKGSLYEGGIRDPLIMTWPRKFVAGTVYSQPVSMMDILPTVVDAAGGLVPKGTCDGVDLVGYVRGKITTAPHRSLYWNYKLDHAIRTGDYKLVAHWDKKRLKLHNYLYNVRIDPAETTDLSRVMPDLYQTMNFQYKTWNALNQSPLWTR